MTSSISPTIFQSVTLDPFSKSRTGPSQLLASRNRSYRILPSLNQAHRGGLVRVVLSAGDVT